MLLCALASKDITVENTVLAFLINTDSQDRISTLAFSGQPLKLALPAERFKLVFLKVAPKEARFDNAGLLIVLFHDVRRSNNYDIIVLVRVIISMRF